MGGLTEREKEMSLTLTQALESVVSLHLYPKAIIDFFITVLENDGSTGAAALTAAGLALADVNIQMFDTVIGTSLWVLGKRTLIEPSRDEEEEIPTENEKGIM